MFFHFLIYWFEKDAYWLLLFSILGNWKLSTEISHWSAGFCFSWKQKLSLLLGGMEIRYLITSYFILFYYEKINSKLSQLKGSATNILILNSFWKNKPLQQPLNFYIRYQIRILNEIQFVTALFADGWLSSSGL